MKMRKNSISAVLQSGFQPAPFAKERVRELMQERLKKAHRMRWQWVAAAGMALLLVAIGMHLRPVSTEINYFGPNAMYASYMEVAQNYGESGPRGLETQSDYVHFQ